MPAVVYLNAREAPLRITQDAEDAVSLFEATPDRPVPLTGEDGGVLFINWRNVDYVADEPELA